MCECECECEGLFTCAKEVVFLHCLLVVKFVGVFGMCD